MKVIIKSSFVNDHDLTHLLNFDWVEPVLPRVGDKIATRKGTFEVTDVIWNLNDPITVTVTFDSGIRLDQ